MLHIPGVGQVVLGHRRRPRDRDVGSTSFRHDGLLRPQKGGWAKVWAWLGLFWAEIKGFHMISPKKNHGWDRWDWD